MNASKAPGQGILYATGGLCADYSSGVASLAGLQACLQDRDIALCHLAGSLTRGGRRMPQARGSERGDPGVAGAFARCGFTAAAIAGDQCLDWGREGLSDTIKYLKAAGVRPVGVGSEIGEARSPLIVETAGGTVALLVYSSALPAGYAAEAGRPGCVPLRAHTFYEQIETDQPGTPARVHVFADRDDVRTMASDIAQARARADVVVVTLWWGESEIGPAVSEFQTDLARAAVDAGAGLILGQQGDGLGGIEVHRGAPIIYALPPLASTSEAGPTSSPSNLNFVVKAVLERGKLHELSILPFLLEEDAPARLAGHGAPSLEVARQWLQGRSSARGLVCSLQAGGDRLLIR